MITYDGCSYDRKCLPPEAMNFDNWQKVDPNLLLNEDKVIFHKRFNAILLYFEQPHLSLSEIERQTGVARSYIRKLAQNCLDMDEHGCQIGFVGLIPNKNLKLYERLKTSKTKPIKNAGFSGSFRSLLKQYPELESFLNQKIDRRSRKSKQARPVKSGYRVIHREFIKLCRTLGISSDHYPFNTKEMGYRSLAAYAKKRLNADWNASVIDAGGRVTTASWRLENDSILPTPVFPYDAVELDGHKIDVRLTLRIPSPYGIEEKVECTRIWILAMEDVVTRCILGYYLAVAVEYSTDDVIEAIHHSFNAQLFSEFTIPGLAYKEGAGFPSSNFKELQYVGFKSFKVDSANANLSNKLMSAMTRVIGCWPDAGPVGKPNNRALVESFFRNISLHFAHRLPGTTGSNPEDIRRILANPDGDISLLITLDELQELIEVIVANYNATHHSSLGGKTPLEAMQYYLAREPGRFYPLSRAKRQELCLFYESKVVTVRGNAAKGERPHINFENCRYSNEILSNSSNMIGKKITLYYSSRDMRKVHAFLMNGEEFGLLYAESKWRYTKHSLQTRRAIVSLMRQRKLVCIGEDDPVEAYIAYKRKTAPKSKKDATDLARVLMQTGLLRENCKKVVVGQTIKTPNKKTREKPQLLNLNLKKTVVF